MKQIENDLNSILNSSRITNNSNKYEHTKGKPKINFKEEIDKLNFKY